MLICTLSPSPKESSSEKIAKDLEDCLKLHDVESTFLRLVDYDIKPGVESDMGDGDDWPKIRKHIVESDILIVSTPTWVGHMSSIAQRAVERLDAELGLEDDQGRPGMFGKVAGVAVVGNEDGAHKISGDLFQALNDVGFTLPANAATYWNDEAMGNRDYKDLESIPEKVQATLSTLANNVVHTAKLLDKDNYPA